MYNPITVIFLLTTAVILQYQHRTQTFWIMPSVVVAPTFLYRATLLSVCVHPSYYLYLSSTLER